MCLFAHEIASINNSIFYPANTTIGVTNGTIGFIGTMKKLNNLLVLGCSVSDYTNVETPWGVSLAKQLNTNYIHEAGAKGSNWRMWRTAFNLVNSKTISPTDTIIIQYTEITRKEIWSPYQKTAQMFRFKGFSKPVPKTDEYDQGVILRFKMNAYKDKDLSAVEQSFLEKYESFISTKFETDYFYMMHNMFQSFMKDNGFKNLYFLKVGPYGPLKSSADLIEFYKNNWINSPNALDDHLQGDSWHMNQHGHDKLAALVHKYIK
jgi:hypothetical protein